MATVTEQEWYAALEAALQPVAEAVPGGQGDALAAALRGYVVAGGDLPVVTGALHEKAVKRLLRGHQVGAGQVTHLQRLLHGLGDVDPATALRWVLLLDSASGGAASSGQRTTLPGGAQWPLTLVQQWSRTVHHDEEPPPFRVGLLDRLEAEAGWPPATTLAAVLAAPERGYLDDHLLGVLLQAPDLDQSLLRHPAQVSAAFGATVGPEGEAVARALVAAGGHVAAPYGALVAALLTSSSKNTRTSAAPLLQVDGVGRPGPVRDALLAVASAGTTDERLHALGALHESASLAGDTAFGEHVRSVAAGDRAVGVRRLAERWATVDAGTGAAPAPVLDPVVIEWSVPLTPSVRAAVDQVWEFLAGYETGWGDSGPIRPGWFGEVRARFDAYLASPEPLPESPRDRSSSGVPNDAVHLLVPSAGPVAGLKLVAFLDLPSSTGTWRLFEILGAAGDLDLRTAAALLAPFGLTPRAVLEQFANPWRQFGHTWPDDVIGPFVAEHAGEVGQLLLDPSSSYLVDRERLFALLGAAPWLPPSLIRTLFDLALGTGKRDRPLAQKALARVEGKSERIVAALADGKAEIRAAAARWLGELGDDAVVPALEAAWRKEKHDVAKAAVLDALEALGRPVEAYLDLGGLLKDAAKTIAKPLPAALDWVPWDVLPALRWADGTAHAGDPVPPDLVRHLAVQAVKAKSPEPNALLRRYCALWDRTSGQAFSLRLLEGWLAHDVTPISREEAEQRADAEARMWHSSLASHPQYHQDHPWLGWSLDDIRAALLPSKLTIPAGSAIDSKGLLALVAATAGGNVAPPVNRYLKQWFGHRTAQAKALLGMLAHVEHPAATALLLSVGNRFRTKGIQDEANRLAAELAERHGWTVDELADRTIPAAGLDEDGVLVLDYGPRLFTAVLAPDLTLALRSPDGAPLKALPSPRSDDDAELAAAAKKTLSAAKKELKATVEQQTTRLYEAMCTGRDWAFDDWQRYLAGHPVVRHLVQRLVWAQTETDDEGAVTVVRLFRPLDDGTLTGADDEPVTVPPDARVRLAHDAFVPADDVAAWTTHLADYEVAPLFGQLGAGFWAVPPERAKETSVEDFVGHVLEAFALRGRATRLGWSRGQAEDAGIFSTYRKRFPTLGLDAVVDFTGNTLPEENRTVALGGLHFERVGDGAEPWNAPVVLLGDVPPVLLSECRNDVRLMAADGEGYRPDWEKVSQWW